MFQRFTERARHAVVLAQDEARALGHRHVGTEHLLLGLIREEDGLAARVLATLEVKLDETRARVEAAVGRGEEESPGMIPFTPRAKKVLELALREALALGHNYIGTEHLLLGLAREDEGVGVEILRAQGIDAERVSDEVLRLLAGLPRMAGEPRRFPLPRRRRFHPVTLVVAGWLLFALALGAGILVGWAIWGT